MNEYTTDDVKCAIQEYLPAIPSTPAGITQLATCGDETKGGVECRTLALQSNVLDTFSTTFRIVAAGGASTTSSAIALRVTCGADIEQPYAGPVAVH